MAEDEEDDDDDDERAVDVRDLVESSFSVGNDPRTVQTNDKSVTDRNVSATHANIIKGSVSNTTFAIIRRKSSRKRIKIDVITQPRECLPKATSRKAPVQSNQPQNESRCCFYENERMMAIK